MIMSQRLKLRQIHVLVLECLYLFSFISGAAPSRLKGSGLITYA